MKPVVFFTGDFFIQCRFMQFLFVFPILNPVSVWPFQSPLHPSAEWTTLAAKEKLASAKTEAEMNRLQLHCESLDRQIDAAVYELYGLTGEEIKSWRKNGNGFDKSNPNEWENTEQRCGFDSSNPPTKRSGTRVRKTRYVSEEP